MVVILGFFPDDVTAVMSGCDIHPDSVNLKNESELCISV